MTADEITMLRTHARYCREQEARRAAEGRHEVARRWRVEAQEAEAKVLDEAKGTLSAEDFAKLADAFDMAWKA